MNLTKISQTPKVKAQTVLVWGASGAGKTVFMGSAGDRALFISNARKHEVLKSTWFKDTYKSDPYVVEIPLDSVPKDAVTGGVNPEKDSFSRIEEAVQEGLKNPDIDTICLDDSTAFVLSSTYRAMKYNMTSGGLTTTLNKAAKFDVIIPELGDYRVEKEHTKQYFSWLIAECKEHNKHLIVGAHIRRIFEAPKKIGEQPKHIQDCPAFTGADKNPDFIPGLFDWVFFMKINEGMISGKQVQKYFAVTEGTEKLVARSSFRGVLPIEWENPNFQTMLKLIEEKG